MLSRTSVDQEQPETEFCVSIAKMVSGLSKRDGDSIELTFQMGDPEKDPNYKQSE